MNFCTTCGTRLVRGLRFCSSCGAPLPAAPEGPEAAASQSAPTLVGPTVDEPVGAPPATDSLSMDLMPPLDGPSTAEQVHPSPPQIVFFDFSEVIEIIFHDRKGVPGTV